MRKIRMLILCFVIMALCGCAFSKANSSTEYSGEPSTSNVDASTGLGQDGIPPIEETMPFVIASDAKIYKYDSNNLLGLCAIYVNTTSEVIYVFDLKKDLAGYSMEDGFRVFGRDAERNTVDICEYELLKDDYRQYLQLKSDERCKIDGFYLTNGVSDFHYELINNLVPVVMEYEYNFSKKIIPATLILSKQAYNTDKKAWNEIEESTDVLQPDIHKD